LTDLQGKVAWITGAGSGIGEAAAIALASAGATVVLTGRRPDPLNTLRDRLVKEGHKAEAEPGDVTDRETPQRIAQTIAGRHGRIDILVNNAGTNVRERNWTDLNPERIDTVVQGNLSSAYYCAAAVLPFMRKQQDGLLIHTSSFAGVFISKVSGSVYSAAKHGVVVMSHTINMEECANGIRSTVICPAEVATPILDSRPNPPPPEARARMLQPADMGDVILYVARLPKHVCMNEVVISPTWNRTYLGQLESTRPQS
jgi:NADP-dependent 3-hydroxy acid dehydrogenase YdfG